MTPTKCDVCEGEGHNEDIIWVDDINESDPEKRLKSFCPNTHERIWTEEELEEMSEEEIAEAEKERIKLVRPERPAVWKIVKESV